MKVLKKQKSMMSVLRKRRIVYRQGYKLSVARLQQILICVAGEQIVLSGDQYWLKESRYKLNIREYEKNHYTQLILDKRDITRIEGVYKRGERLIRKAYSYL